MDSDSGQASTAGSTTTPHHHQRVEDDADAQRLAIQRELEDKLRGHQDYVASLQGQQPNARQSQSSAQAGTALSDPASKSVHNNARNTAVRPEDSAPQDEVPSSASQPTATGGMPQPVTRNGQMANEQHLEPDELDSDSALGSDASSRTTSLSESIYNHRKEHGRTYHAYKDGKYIFPNDEREADRLDLQHHLFRITYAYKLFFAPLQNPRRCLDVGTGTGIWAVDLADDFPDCQVTGIDLSPGQPTMVPPNVKFVIDDAEDDWLYEEKFDFIHARLMAGCFADWPSLLQKAFDNLEEGGWLELQDYGLPVKSFDQSHIGTDLLRWGELLCEAARKLGRPMGSDVSTKYEEWMRDAGFVDIQQKMFMWPSNSWPKDPFMKELGRWNQVNIIEGLEGFCMALLTRGLGWSKEEVDVFVAKIAADLRNKKIHAYFPMPVTFGRKPFRGEVAFQS
ncbi:related to methyltransferase [Lecanosticta acicola]|uniref:Related to methyltransferase n=1 Tax=Lecanosticta acicola TaxID=111012 RepID=A0AAI8Z1D8_9PEZI|nr:related to methyltransferase [Lecanosticta acicola]